MGAYTTTPITRQTCLTRAQSRAKRLALKVTAMTAVRTTSFADTAFTTKEAFSLSAAEGDQFLAFSEWHEDLWRYVREVGTEECGLAVTSPLLAQYLVYVALRVMAEGDVMSHLYDRFVAMPKLPTVWPDTWDVPEVLAKLDALLDGKAEFPAELLPALATEVRVQAEKLQQFATSLEKGRAA
ncbi:hypothetical protein [Methylobacterium nigriterrae]|uniref:hypothetical protein n=1 Tax=Methylobacterium nigriterrae TaxID=3127512 RepID=UPI003013CC12